MVFTVKIPAKLLRKVSRIRKLVIATMALGATWAGAALADGEITLGEWLTLIPVVLGAWGVWRVPNDA